MEYQNSYLRKTIEKMRKDLIQLGKYKHLTDPEVVKLSQKLDDLLNEYQKLQTNQP